LRVRAPSPQIGTASVQKDTGAVPANGPVSSTARPMHPNLVRSNSLDPNYVKEVWNLAFFYHRILLIKYRSDIIYST
jgi:hypothetical protein